MDGGDVDGRVLITYVYDCNNRLISPSEARSVSTEDGAVTQPDMMPRYSFEHDKDKAVFRVKWYDGTVEVFRDNATCYLVLEPDYETGGLKPETTHGQPTYLYLCRQEREVR